MHLESTLEKWEEFLWFKERGKEVNFIQHRILRALAFIRHFCFSLGLKLNVHPAVSLSNDSKFRIMRHESRLTWRDFKPPLIVKLRSWPNDAKNETRQIYLFVRNWISIWVSMEKYAQIDDKVIRRSPKWKINDSETKNIFKKPQTFP